LNTTSAIFSAMPLPARERLDRSQLLSGDKSLQLAFEPAGAPRVAGARLGMEQPEISPD
jgi:hypothetical protein